jgi:hypothetical protein
MAEGTNGGWCFGIASASAKIQIPGLVGPYTDFAVQAFSDSTNPDERGNRILLPFPATLAGVMIASTRGGTPDTNDDYSVTLYTDILGSPSGTPLNFDGEVGLGFMNIWLPLAPVDLAAGTVYGLATKSLGAGGHQMIRYDYAANADLGWGCGVDFYSITRNNSSGAFTADTAKVYAIYPVFSHLDSGFGARARSMVGVM